MLVSKSMPKFFLETNEHPQPDDQIMKSRGTWPAHKIGLQKELCWIAKILLFVRSIAELSVSLWTTFNAQVLLYTFRLTKISFHMFLVNWQISQKVCLMDTFVSWWCPYPAIDPLIHSNRSDPNRTMYIFPVSLTVSIYLTNSLTS